MATENQLFIIDTLANFLASATNGKAGFINTGSIRELAMKADGNVMIITPARYWNGAAYVYNSIHVSDITADGVAAITGAITGASASVTGDATAAHLKSTTMQLGTPTYKYIDDWFDVTQSSGKISGFTITAHAPDDGTVDVAAGTGIIKTTNANGAVTKFFDFAGVASIALTDNALNFLYVDYNAGTPRILATTDRTTVNEYNQFIIGRIYRQGTDSSEINNTGVWVYDTFRRQNNKEIEKYGIDHISGAVVSEVGTRGLATTAGAWYIGYASYTTPAYSTAVGGYTFDTFYHTASTWGQHTGATQFDNTNYDNGTGLTALTNNHYAAHWVYICTQGDIYLVYSQADYATLAAAQAATAPASLPTYISSNTSLAARVIIKKGDTNATQVDSYWTKAAVSSAATTHNGLAGLQGGTTDEYYHLTSARAASLASSGSPDFVAMTLTDRFKRRPTTNSTTLNWINAVYTWRTILTPASGNGYQIIVTWDCTTLSRYGMFRIDVLNSPYGGVRIVTTDLGVGEESYTTNLVQVRVDSGNVQLCKKSGNDTNSLYMNAFVIETYSPGGTD